MGNSRYASTLAAHKGARTAAGRTLGRLIAPTFGLLTRLRRARAFHPEGHAYAAEIEMASTAPLEPGRYQGVVRLSRGIGLPEPWPDFLGQAVRMLDGDGVAGIQDLLLVSSVSAVGGRQLIVPRRGYGLWPRSHRWPSGGVRYLMSRAGLAATTA